MASLSPAVKTLWMAGQRLFELDLGRRGMF